MTRVDKALADIPPHSVVMNDFGISGWLLWTHPELVPAADLRVEIYPSGYLRQYIDAGSAKPGWQSFLDRVHARYALLDRTSALSDALVHEQHWTTMATGDTFVLLHAPQPAP